MLVAEGDESAMATLFLCEIAWWMWVMSVMLVVFMAQPSYFVSKIIGGKSTVVTTEVGFKLSKYYMLFGDSIVSPI
jgi:hypothetical protein